MHKLILKLLDFLKQTIYFFQMLSVFFILMLTLYWVKNIISANWHWMDYIAKPLDSLLNISSVICSCEWNLFGSKFEVKYIIGILLLLTLSFIFKTIYDQMYNITCAYKNLNIDFKRHNEKILNKKLHEEQKTNELKINQYSVFIKTAVAKKYSHVELNVNIDELNKDMNDFLFKKTGVQYIDFKDGFLYSYDDFSKIDTVLDALYKVIKMPKIDCIICIQAGHDYKQLTKLADYGFYNKIVIAADTMYRYRFNKYHRYETATIGDYQNGNITIQLHEFKEML